MPSRVRRHILPVLLAVGASALAVPAAAAADSGTSTNWAGYAIHRNRVHFSRVVGAWRQPTAQCVRHNPTYSAFWIGIGGFSETSNALEQIGTEVDCTSSGTVASSAWYELVPAPSVDLTLRVRPGDEMEAIVSVNGHTVGMELRDVTRHTEFHRNFRASDIDTTSAEWIAEAPSECSSDTSCQTLPLADFGSATFGLATARAGGHTGSITDSRWGTTEIYLNPGTRQYVTYRGVGPGIGTASPSRLGTGGTSFTIDFGTIPLSGSQFLATKADAARALPGGRIVHPLR